MSRVGLVMPSVRPPVAVPRLVRSAGSAGAARGGAGAVGPAPCHRARGLTVVLRPARARGSCGRTRASSGEAQPEPEQPEQEELEPEEEQRRQLQERLAQQVRDEAAKQRKADALYTMGKLAYEQGAYKNSVTALEEAMEILSPNSEAGGEAQLWLALAYEACQRNDEALNLYQKLENSHPMPQIRKQAADLRYIFEAPKLKIGENERVKVPVLDEVDKYGSNRPVTRRVQRKKIELTLEERVMRDYKPPIKIPNKYILVASTVVTLGVAYYSALLAR